MADHPTEATSFVDRLGPESVAVLRAASFLRAYGQGEIAMAEGQLSREVLIIERGWVEVVKGTADGREMVIAQRGPGELVGELSAIDSLPRTASVRCATAVEVAVVPSREFVQIVTADPQLALALLNHVAARVRQASGNILEQGVVDGMRRVCRHLATLIERQAAQRGDTGLVGTGSIVDIGSQEHLGLVVGLHRSTLVRILSDLRQSGIIETGRGTVTVIDADRLHALASLSS